MKDLIFIQITDIHFKDTHQQLLHNINISEVISHIFNDINLKHPEIEFIIITGDISDSGNTASYLAINDIIKNYKIPIFWLPGNHDNLNNIFNINQCENVSSSKAFSKNGFNFVLLNSVSGFEKGLNKSRGVLDICELEFLKLELIRKPNLQHIIALHHSPIRSGTWKDERMLQNANEFFDIVKQYQNVCLVIFGHQHHSSFDIIDKIIYFSPPAASYQFDKIIKWGFDNFPPGYGKIHLNPGGIIKCETIYINYKIDPIFNPGSTYSYNLIF